MKLYDCLKVSIVPLAAGVALFGTNFTPNRKLVGPPDAAREPAPLITQAPSLPAAARPTASPAAPVAPIAAKNTAMSAGSASASVPRSPVASATPASAPSPNT
ncbi:hypothetical protein, partial [Trichothermofontia sp.]